MKQCLPYVVICLAILCNSASRGADLAKVVRACRDKPHCCLSPRVPGCPDDYCRNPLPCIPGLSSCRTCDDYCRKPIPCIPCLCCCALCDDYCRKPLPCFYWPIMHLSCVSSNSQCDQPAVAKVYAPR